MRLAVKLVVPEGQEVPVALETEDGATFLGKAKLSPTRRVEVNLDQAVLAGKVFPVRAVVLGADLAQGLPADARTYDQAAGILRHLGVHQVRLMTNNPKKVVGLDGYGLRITERIPIQILANDNNRRYLETKKNKLGHILDGTNLKEE